MNLKLQRLIPITLVLTALLNGCAIEDEEDVDPDQNIAPVLSADATPEMARFLMRATFGPTAKDINHLANIGYSAWLDEQFNKPPTYQLPKLTAALRARGWIVTGADFSTERRNRRMDIWWNAVINGNDQLRQRVAFALSQIFVISELDTALKNRVQGMANYNDIMVKHAFGNYRDLLEDVTLSPMMGNYLSMRRNEKANPASNISPDENYAREVMQLFSIGLFELNTDGTKKKDSFGNTIQTYDQEEILNFARVYTGWNYGDASALRDNTRNLDSEIIPMKAFDEFHDTDEKILLNGAILPAGQSAEQDLEQALDNIFNHPNVGPFISRQLIQKLITSNPSPAYIRRVAEKFNNNGQGVRGDLKAVVRAIFIDPEATTGHITNSSTFGKVKEPLLKISALWRAFSARGNEGYLRFSNTQSYMSQKPYASPSVFNFFSPNYKQPGGLDDLGLFSPEFQIINDATIVSTTNILRNYAYSHNLGSGDNASRHKILLNINAEKLLAEDPVALIDRLDLILMAGSMSNEMRTILIDFLSQTPLNDDGSTRVKEVLYLIITSPEYALQR